MVYKTRISESSIYIIGDVEVCELVRGCSTGISDFWVDVSIKCAYFLAFYVIKCLDLACSASLKTNFIIF